jgi:hypothetical protein
VGSEERGRITMATEVQGPRSKVQGLPAPRRRILAALLLIVPLGLFIKYFPPDPLRHWGRWHGGAVVYEVFWALAAGWVWPRAPAWRIGAAVFAATCALEFAQLWHPRWLQAVRRTLPGRMLIGTTFDPTDFPYYAGGSALGAALLAALRGRGGPGKTGLAGVPRPLHSAPFPEENTRG